MLYSGPTNTKTDDGIYIKDLSKCINLKLNIMHAHLVLGARAQSSEPKIR